MKHLWEDFTVIDFMGMFIPGALFVLVTENAPFPFRELCVGFFGADNDLALAVYFVIFSYMIGTFFIECSKGLEQCFCKDLVGTQYAQSAAYDAGSEAKKWFCSLESPPRFSDIKVAVHGQGTYRKRMLFSGFYELCRTLLVAIPASIAVRLIGGYDICILTLPTVHAPCIHVILYLGILYIILRRMRRFLKYTVEYTYGDYHRLCCSGSQSEDSSHTAASSETKGS